MKRRFLSICLCIAMLSVFLAGCGAEQKEEAESRNKENAEEEVQKDTLEGVHIFMFKSSGNSFGDLMYEGFAKYLAAKGEKVSYQSPAETTVKAQVEMLGDLIERKVGSITISTNGDTGYEEVFQKAKEAGIPIVSVDSEVSPKYRVCHISQADIKDIGAYLVQTAVLISLGIDYPGDKADMKTVVEEALADYMGEEIKLGVLSAWIDTPVQNLWIASMEEELTNPCYAGKVSDKLDKKYGNDDFTESALQANAFVEENKVDCIVAPTTVGIQAAGQVLINSDSKIKLTGLGLPSEMQAFMPGNAADDAFSYVCPYMILWDVMHLGATAGAVTYAAVHDGFTGEAGSSFVMDAFDDYEETIYTAEGREEGTVITAGVPYVFYKENMTEWVDKL